MHIGLFVLGVIEFVVMVYFIEKFKSSKLECDDLAEKVIRMSNVVSNYRGILYNMVRRCNINLKALDCVTIDSKLCDLTDGSYISDLFENRKIIMLPNGKYQLVELDKSGIVRRSTEMGIVDSFDKVIEYIKTNGYYIILEE